jgi:hypothetical protein
MARLEYNRPPMKGKLYIGMILGLASALAGCSSMLDAQTRKRLWILQASYAFLR